MGGAAVLVMALGLWPAFQPAPTPVSRPLLWETPVSWSAPAPAPPRLSCLPAVAVKIKAAQTIKKEKGPAQAAAHLAKVSDPELLLLRAGLHQLAGDLPKAQADYEAVLNSKNRTAPRAVALVGFKNVLRQRIEKGDPVLYGRLIQCLKEEWRNQDALDLLPGILADPKVPAPVKTSLRKLEPILSLRLGRFDRAAELWAAPADRSETQWLAQTEQRRGNFQRSAELRLELAGKSAGQARRQEIQTAWEVLAKGGLLAEAEALAEKNPELKKTADYSWRMGLAALSAGEPAKAREFFENAANTKNPARRAGAGYFLARALGAAGRDQEAGAAYAEVAEGPFGYYQILARGRLAAPPERNRNLAAPLVELLNPGPSGRDQDTLGYLLWITEKGLSQPDMEGAAAGLVAATKIDDRDPLVGALLNLAAGGDWARVWEFTKNNAASFQGDSPATKPLPTPLAASLAAWSGNYRRAVSLLAGLPSPEPGGLKRWSHPLVYSRQVRAANREHGLSPALLLALIRTESAYQADIMSASNARGLMQLLPATANRVAARLGEPEPGALALFDPELNIRYGAWYLAALVEGFGEEALALAGYNGGPYNIKSLILAKKGMPLDVFVETLTFEETSKYVKRITESRYIYEMAYLGEASLPDLTRPVQPPRPSLPDF